MKVLIQRFWDYPAVALAGLAAVVNAVQVAAVPLPSWAHAVVAVASIMLAGAGTHQLVTPAKKKPRRRARPSRRSR